MHKLLWSNSGWDDYLYWQDQDRKTLRKINKIIQDIQRDPFHGIGKPEPLVGNLKGWWSRRIDESNRIVYRFENDTITIAECRSHYGEA